MQTSASDCLCRDHFHVATIAQLQRPLLDGALPRFRCLAWLTVTILALLIGIQLTGAPAV